MEQLKRDAGALTRQMILCQKQKGECIGASLLFICSLFYVLNHLLVDQEELGKYWNHFWNEKIKNSWWFRSSRDDYKGVPFISLLIIADLKEIYNLPFGTPKEIISGYGGGMGLQATRTQAGIHYPYEYRAKKLLENIYEFNDLCLVCMGVERIGDKLFVAWTGRLITLI